MPCKDVISGTADPETINNARNLLERLYTLPDRDEKRVISGQDVGSIDAPEGNDRFILALQGKTGKLPAMIGTDYVMSPDDSVFIDVDRKTQTLIDYWNSGGLLTVHASLGKPWSHYNASRGDISTGTGRYQMLTHLVQRHTKSYKRTLIDL